jgi:hypothetical protein
MEVPVVEEVRLGMELARSVAWWWSMASLGSAPWTDGDVCHPAYRRHPYGASDHHDAMLIVFFFFSLLIPLTAP